MQFKYFVMSDWDATHSTVQSMQAGLDMEMAGDVFFGQPLADAVSTGQVSIDAINQSVERILTPMFKFGMFDDPNVKGDPLNVVTTPEHKALSRTISSASSVLLKNEEDLLPLPSKGPYKLALIGGMARNPIVGGGGSGSVFPAYTISPFQGILNALGLADVDPATFSCNNSTVLNNITFDQGGCVGVPSLSQEDCSVKCGNYGGCTFYTYYKRFLIFH